MSVREKGNRFEREVAEMFTETFGMHFRRTPLSGGWDKSKLQGDITSGDAKFALVVECKNHKSFKVPEWWKQVDSDTPTGKFPLLVPYVSARYHSSKQYKLRNAIIGAYVLLRKKDFMYLMSTNYKLFNEFNIYTGKSISFTKILYEMQMEDRKIAVVSTDVYSGTPEEFVFLPLSTFLLHIDRDRCYTRPRKTRIRKRRR